MALRGILIGVALGAEELLILGGEGLVHQRALALEALEAVLVPVAVLVGQILRVQQTDTQNWFSKLLFNLCFVTSLTLELQPIGFLHSSQVLEYRLS